MKISDYVFGMNYVQQTHDALERGHRYTIESLLLKYNRNRDSFSRTFGIFSYSCEIPAIRNAVGTWGRRWNNYVNDAYSLKDM